VALTAVLRRFLLEVDDDDELDGSEVADHEADLDEDVLVVLEDDDDELDDASPYYLSDEGPLPGSPYYEGQQ
jgi:hypothetical protein